MAALSTKTSIIVTFYHWTIVFILFSSYSFVKVLQTNLTQIHAPQSTSSLDQRYGICRKSEFDKLFKL